MGGRGCSSVFASRVDVPLSGCPGNGFLLTRDTSGREVELRHSVVWAIATCSTLPPAVTGAEIVYLDPLGLVRIDARDWRKRRDLSKLAQVVPAEAESPGALGPASQG
jgi:hypothetical protein